MSNTIIENNNIAYSSDLTSASGGKVVRRKRPASLALAILVLLAGIGLLIACPTMGDPSGAAYTASLIFGIAAAGTGLCLVLFGGREWVYLPTKSKVSLHSKFIDPQQADAVCRTVEMRDPSLLDKGLKTVETSGVRVDLYTSADGRFAAAQTFRYVPYTYIAATPVCCAYGEPAKRLAGLF